MIVMDWTSFDDIVMVEIILCFSRVKFYPIRDILFYFIFTYW